ncbi:hypothetical protein PoB_005497100 [Plakobranchus ocellatus]|uniref:Uncharacterized protein n=1 Tax=Plakobranchus ocellatus TaxID=259542 RepID=A0AAV4BZB8_9GAST|nr:hypothetical protein PoB_005497100 [Plakobranchus ocellatus]
MILGSQALRRARALVAGLEPATKKSLQISGMIRYPLCHRISPRKCIDSETARQIVLGNDGADILDISDDNHLEDDADKEFEDKEEIDLTTIWDVRVLLKKTCTLRFVGLE